MSLTKNDREFIKALIEPVKDSFDIYIAQHGKDHAILEAKVNHANTGAKDWMVTKDRARFGVGVVKWTIIMGLVLGGGSSVAAAFAGGFGNLIKLLNGG